MKIFPLLFRIVAFSISLFLLLEFIVACQVSTKTGVILLFVSTAIAAIIFIMFRMNHIKICSHCSSAKSIAGNFSV